MAPQIIASLVLLYWLAQSARLTRQTWSDGYSPFWVAFQGLATLSLLIPLYLVWR